MQQKHSALLHSLRSKHADPKDRLCFGLSVCESISLHIPQHKAICPCLLEGIMSSSSSWQREKDHTFNTHNTTILCFASAFCFSNYRTARNEKREEREEREEHRKHKRHAHTKVKSIVDYELEQKERSSGWNLSVS